MSVHLLKHSGTSALLTDVLDRLLESRPPDAIQFIARCLRGAMQSGSPLVQSYRQ